VLIFAALVVAGLIAALIVRAARQPDTFRIQRTATINASPDRIFPLLNDFRNWKSWSPWEKLDPTMKRTHSGPSSGRGAIYEWAGNRKAGRGRMEITESVPHIKMTIKLDFYKPFEAHNTTQFTLTPSGDATNISWSMFGSSPFMMRLMVFDLDRMVGRDYEKGLASLKTVVEGARVAAS
jgi:uncharacterized protein YndB with AHSA1/START domain